MRFGRRGSADQLEAAVETNRGDAISLARIHRAGELTAVWVPNETHEAIRDLVRAREVAKRRLEKIDSTFSPSF